MVKGWGGGKEIRETDEEENEMVRTGDRKGEG